MYCARCGNNLGEQQHCGQCGWTYGEINIPAEQLIRPSTGDGCAIASLVCGIFSWMSLGGLGIIPIIGIIFGMIGLKSRQSEVAVVGIAINIAIVVLSLLVILLFGVAVLSGGSAPSSAVVSGGRCC